MGDTARGHAGAVFAVAWGADGTRLASGEADRAVRVWEAAYGKPVHVLGGRREPVGGVARRPDGKRLASAGRLG